MQPLGASQDALSELTTMQTLNVLIFIAIVLICVISSYRLAFRVLYTERTEGLLDTQLLNSSPLSTSVRTLVNRFDPSIGFVVSADALTLAEAVSFGSRPAYIVFSKKLLEQSSGENSYFDENDLSALAAHELGHIIPKGRLEIYIMIAASVFLFVISMTIWLRMPALLLLLLPLLMCLGIISRKEEYRADSFAVNEAGISIHQFTRSLVKGNEFLIAQRISYENPWKKLTNRLIKPFFISHPSVEQRVSRLQSLYARSTEQD